MVTNELPLFPSWITASFALKYVSFVEGLNDGLVALMFSTQALCLKCSFPGSVNLTKSQQTSLHLLYKDCFSIQINSCPIATTAALEFNRQV